MYKNKNWRFPKDTYVYLTFLARNNSYSKIKFIRMRDRESPSQEKISKISETPYTVGNADSRSSMMRDRP